nr:ABC transporter permease [Streptomyces sp. SM11]
MRTPLMWRGIGRAVGETRPSWRRQVSVGWVPGNRVAACARHIKGCARGVTDREGARIRHGAGARVLSGARLEIVRPAASDALLPGLDQTRTVGLVTLPGAFVGMLLGGASPVEAGAVQLFVLVALMAVQVVAVAVVLELVARGLLHRD